MNLHAAALGLADTHYANPIGLDQAGNYSSALDLTTLTRRLLRIPVFARIAASRHAVLTSLRPRRRISSVNALLRMAPWVNGVKTGHTVDARFVLVGAGRRRNVELIAAVVGARTDEDRFDDALTSSTTGSPSIRGRRRSAPAGRFRLGRPGCGRAPGSGGRAIWTGPAISLPAGRSPSESARS